MTLTTQEKQILRDVLVEGGWVASYDWQDVLNGVESDLPKRSLAEAVEQIIAGRESARRSRGW